MSNVTKSDSARRFFEARATLPQTSRQKPGRFLNLKPKVTESFFNPEPIAVKCWLD